LYLYKKPRDWAVFSPRPDVLGLFAPGSVLFRRLPNSCHFGLPYGGELQRHCCHQLGELTKMLHATTQSLGEASLSKRDALFLARLDGLTDRFDKLDDLLAQIEDSIATKGVAEQRLIDLMNRTISKVAQITTKIENAASDALAPDIADMRLLIESKFEYVEDLREGFGDAIVDRSGMQSVNKAIRQLNFL